MAGFLQPLDDKFAIVDSNGRPTDYFIKWAQQKQIDIGEGLTLALLEEYLLAHQLQEGSGIQFTPDGNLANSPTIAADVQEILDQISTTRGSILYRGAADWLALAPGTAGNFLKTNGAGADPAWTLPPAGGAFLVRTCFNSNTLTTWNVNSTAYIFNNFWEAMTPIDLDYFPFTHFRIEVHGQSNAAGATVTAQLAVNTAGAFVSAAGNDLVINNTIGFFDSGWVARADGRTTGRWYYAIALKGSTATVDLAMNWMAISFR